MLVNDQLTNYPTMLIVLDVPQQLAEVEVLEEDPAHVLVVDCVQNLFRCQRLNFFPRLLIIMPLKNVQNVKPKTVRRLRKKIPT